MDDIIENRASLGLVDLGQLALRHQGEDVALLRLAFRHVCPRCVGVHQDSKVGDIKRAFGKTQANCRAGTRFVHEFVRLPNCVDGFDAGNG